MHSPNFTSNHDNLSEKALVTTALNLLLIHGEQKVTVAKLIASAGVSKATFYRFFANIEDVFAAILLADEEQISALFLAQSQPVSVSQLLQDYLRHRLQSIERYRILNRLERLLFASHNDGARFGQWQALRRQHVTEFSAIVESQLAKNSQVDDENVRFYYGLVWALANGVAQVTESDFFHELIHDRRGFVRFLLDSMHTLGQEPKS